MTPNQNPTAPTTTASVPTGESESIGRLLVTCRDQLGLVAAMSELLRDLGANIVALDQYSSDPRGGEFFQRTEFHLPGLPERLAEVEAALEDRIRTPFGAEAALSLASVPKRVAIMVSKTDHCLLDLLWRQRNGELPIEVVLVISNHPDLGDVVRSFGIEFVHVPVTGDKSAAEAQHLELLRDRVDLVVLARYMQIISETFLDRVGAPIINIHHSFLPAFIGAAPYRKAKERGVKLVGATAHYVTGDLDEGPIIEQDVVRVSHRDTTRELVRRGADVERQVLSRAVAWHCEDRVIRHGNTTIVF